MKEQPGRLLSNSFTWVLLSNGKFLTPVEMEIMESLGVVRTTKI
jgi:hypothetical protein